MRSSPLQERGRAAEGTQYYRGRATFKTRERLQTLDIACDAVLGECIGVSHILGGTSQNDALGALFERFKRQGRHAAPLDPATPA
jgi:hypothetical protein